MGREPAKGNRGVGIGNSREVPSEPRQPDPAVTPTVTELGMSRNEKGVARTLDCVSHDRRLLNVRQAGVYLNLSPWTVRSLGWSGTIPEVRVGRRVLFDVVDLDKFIERAKRA